MGANTHDPTGTAVWVLPWGVANQWWPNKIFFEDFVIDPVSANESVQMADGVEAGGTVAMGGGVAWIDTYPEGLPKGPGGEGGLALGYPAWVKYSEWIKQRDDLIGRDRYGSYGWYDLGWIFPGTPLDRSDWAAAGVPHATYSDFIAERYARCCARWHLGGLWGADLIIGLPTGTDFHPRNIEAFEQRLGYMLPGETPAEKARYITAKLGPEWTDYCCDGFAHLFASIGKKIRAYRGKEPMVGGQIASDPTMARWLGNDTRRCLKLMPADNWFFELETQGDGMRAMRSASSYSALAGTSCAWEPSMQLGAVLNVFNGDLQASLVAGGQPDAVGEALLHSQWFPVMFAHVATREGGVRRGVTAIAYGYGMIDTWGIDARVTAAVFAHIPRRPFGPGFYFSEAMVRAVEREGAFWMVADAAAAAAAKAGFGYYATDAALDGLNVATKPACWVVVRPELLPATERAKLEQWAPVVTPEQATQLTPLRTSANGNSWGFIDQNGALVVVVANLARGDSAVQLDITGLNAGAWSPTDALTGTTVCTLTASGGKARMVLNVGDHDTRVLVFPAAAVANF